MLFLQCLCGEAYITKFMIQILSSGEKISSFEGSSEANTNTSLPKSSYEQDSSSTFEFLPVIQGAKLFAILSMTFLIRRLRIRFLCFLSLILTVIILILLGLISNDAFSSTYFTPYSIRIIKTVLLCLYVIFIQLGVQTLPGLLMEVIYPTSCRSMLKGLCISIGSVFLIILLFVLKSFSYSHSFWIMGGLLLTATPFLYVFLPEIRNIGTDMCVDYFLPFQTVFYYSKSRVDWKDQLEHIKEKDADLNSIARHIFVIDECAKDNHQVHFDEAIPSVEEISSNRDYELLNRQRVSFVSNILGQNGFLTKNVDKSRVLLGRGLIKFKTGVINKGSIFLFSDVLILARCVLAGRRYVAEIYFRLNSLTFSMETEGAEMVFKEKANEETVVEFEDQCLAQSWNKYIQFARSRLIDILISNQDANQVRDMVCHI